MEVLGTTARPYIRQVQDIIRMGLEIQRTPSILAPSSFHIRFRLLATRFDQRLSGVVADTDLPL